MKDLHILLAEDNRGDVLLVQESLQEHRIHHQLHVVSDSEEALDYINRVGRTDEVPRPDVLLLDLNLPKGDGTSVLAGFRQNPACADIPVIVVTSSDSPRERERVAQLGISHYFRKPTEYDDYMQLGALVRKILGLSA